MKHARNTEADVDDMMMNQAPHILVVDEHRDIREPLAAFLKKQGMRVTTASNAAVAREVLAKGAIDLIVLDIMMPGEDGVSLCAYVREATDIPMIFLTAMAETVDRIVGTQFATAAGPTLPSIHVKTASSSRSTTMAPELRTANLRPYSSRL